VELANHGARNSSSLGSRSRRSQYHGGSLPATSVGAKSSSSSAHLARLNIYESIENSPDRRLRANESSSTGRLEPDECQGLLFGGSQSSNQQLHRCNHQEGQHHDCYSNCDLSFRRRFQEEPPRDLDEVYVDNPLGRRNLTNPYSEITNSKPTLVPSVTDSAATVSGYDRAPTYAVVHTPSQSRVNTTSHVNDEINQLIEIKRKRTLLLLKAKEAPRASIEVTSPIEENPIAVDSDHQSEARLSPVLSDYENLSSKNLDAINRLDNQALEAKIATYCGDDCGAEVVSPSESQNFNTLSIVSDILGDLSQEENSLVQQLGKG